MATHRHWRLPYAAVEPPEARGTAATSATAPPAQQPPKAPREAFQRGQKVAFEDRHLRPQVGTITRINPQTASIDTGDGMQWKVSFGLLRHVVDV